MNLFKKTHFYVKIYFNKIEITNLDTAETITKSAIEKFSTKRIVIANFNIAELLLREGFNELKTKKGFLPLGHEVLMQQMEEFEDGISEIEKRALRDMAEQAGAMKVFLILETKKISVEEAMNGLKNEEFSR